jgi:uncharacterized protein (TIGR02391 family)
VFFHVRVSTKSSKQWDEIKLDLSEDDLYSQILRPYERGDPITVNGTTIPPTDINRIRITTSEWQSEDIRPTVLEEIRRSNVVTWIPPEWNIANKGKDITDELIKGAPGYRRLPSAAPPSAAFQIGIESLHPKIVQRCRVPFESGQCDDAMLNALKTVEEEIRSRISAGLGDYRVNLVSKALSPKAPLLQFSSLDSEQEAAHALYRGAIGLLKNPLSHRFLDNNDPIRTFEALCFASLLLYRLDEAERTGT